MRMIIPSGAGGEKSFREGQKEISNKGISSCCRQTFMIVRREAVFPQLKKSQALLHMINYQLEDDRQL